MKKVLIVFATREGQAEKVARAIAEQLRKPDTEVKIVDAKSDELKSTDLAQFDQIVCGGSLHAGGTEKELVEFIQKNQSKIQSSENAFFLVLLSAATKDKGLREEMLRDARKKLSQQLPFEFNHLEMIAGALLYSKYSWPLKWVMRKIAKKAGEDTDTTRDYEYTDWKQVKDFANRLLAN